MRDKSYRLMQMSAGEAIRVPIAERDALTSQIKTAWNMQGLGYTVKESTREHYEVRCLGLVDERVKLPWERRRVFVNERREWPFKTMVAGDCERYEKPEKTKALNALRSYLRCRSEDCTAVFHEQLLPCGGVLITCEAGASQRETGNRRWPVRELARDGSTVTVKETSSLARMRFLEAVRLYTYRRRDVDPFTYEVHEDGDEIRVTRRDVARATLELAPADEDLE